MKLFKLFKRYIILTMLAVLLLGSFAHFFVFRFFIHRSTDSILYEYKNYIENYVARNDTLIASSLSVLQPPRVEEKLISNLLEYKEFIKDTLLYSESTGEFLPYRQLYFTISYKNYSHLVNINQPTVETDDLFYAVISSLVILFLLFIVFTYLVGNYVQNRLWAPFYKLLGAVQKYDFQKSELLKLEDTGITEFDELNSVINKMVSKIHSDYLNLKTFTEDVSHEMQTPLSIIKSKLDILVQAGITNENNTNDIRAIYNAVTRMSKFNKSLLLITKINNNQFHEKEEVNFAGLFNEYLDDLNELIAAKNIKANCNCKEPFIVLMSMTLAETVISNLLSNAIRYNKLNGVIDIFTHKNGFTVKNTSENPVESKNLLNRYIKGKAASSNGMGLSIVKSICDSAGLQVAYHYENGFFQISITYQNTRCTIL